MKGEIVAEGVGKRYRRHPPSRSHTLQETVMRGFRQPPSTWFWGLKDVSFRVSPGTTVGVVGRNGAGKSSLLRLIGGVGRPDEGRISVGGRIGALLDLGAGMTDDLTGRENAVLAGMIAGMRRSEVMSKLDSIVAFAELEDVIDEPFRTYSSGMRLRLAFAVAIHIEPDILLVDEVLAVGDTAFQRKCLERIAQIKEAGCTIFFVSHDEAMVSALCDEVLYLRDGHAIAFGPTKAVLKQYMTYSGNPGTTAERTLPDGRRLKFDTNRFGLLDAQITEVTISREKGQPADQILCGSGLSVTVRCERTTRLDAALVSITITNAENDAVFETNTTLYEIGVFSGSEVDTAVVELRIDRLDLAPGQYSVDVGLFSLDWSVMHDYHMGVYGLEVLPIGFWSGRGLLQPPCRWIRLDPAQGAKESNSKADAR